jgi:hypothetical protein
MKTPKYFYRVTESGEPVPGTLARLDKKPITGKWKEIKSVCCTEECGPVEDTTAGDSFDLFIWSNGVQTAPTEIISATNSFSVVGNTITLYNGKTSTIVDFKFPKVNGIEPYEQFNFGQGSYNMGILDYIEDPEDSNYWITKIIIEFAPYSVPAFAQPLASIYAESNLPIDDIFITTGGDSSVRLFDGNYKMLYPYHSAITCFVEFMATPTINYDVNFWWQGVIVHTIANQSTQSLSFNSGVVTGAKFDKITIDPVPEP